MPALKKDDELDKLEEDIRKLKNKYDQFFAGIAKVPPSQDRRNIEIFIHEFSKQKMRDNTRRFRFNTMLTRYNQYREMWARKMREREEGPIDYRRRQAAMTSSASPVAPPTSQRVTQQSGDPYVRMAAGANGDSVRQLYEQIQRESQKIGKPPSVTFEQLNNMVQQQSEKLRQRYNVNTVAFRVDTVEGKVVVKAKPIQD